MRIELKKRQAPLVLGGVVHLNPGINEVNEDDLKKVAKNKLVRWYVEQKIVCPVAPVAEQPTPCPTSKVVAPNATVSPPQSPQNEDAGKQEPDGDHSDGSEDAANHEQPTQQDETPKEEAPNQSSKRRRG